MGPCRATRPGDTARTAVVLLSTISTVLFFSSAKCDRDRIVIQSEMARVYMPSVPNTPNDSLYATDSLLGRLPRAKTNWSAKKKAYTHMRTRLT